MGILMRNTQGEIIQLNTDLQFKEAFSLCINLRSKHDDNHYWIGTK